METEATATSSSTPPPGDQGSTTDNTATDNNNNDNNNSTPTSSSSLKQQDLFTSINPALNATLPPSASDVVIMNSSVTPQSSTSNPTATTITPATAAKQDLHIHAKTLHFPPPLNRVITNVLKFTNQSTSSTVAFKIKTNRPNRYSVKPHVGTVSPRETIEVLVRFNPQKDTVTNLKDRDKFQVQSFNLTEEQLQKSQQAANVDYINNLFKEVLPEIVYSDTLKCRFAVPIPHSHPQDLTPIKPEDPTPPPKVDDNSNLREKVGVLTGQIADLKKAYETLIKRRKDEVERKILGVFTNVELGIVLFVAFLSFIVGFSLL